jgi:hypothetical protein
MSLLSGQFSLSSGLCVGVSGRFIGFSGSDSRTPLSKGVAATLSFPALNNFFAFGKSSANILNYFYILKNILKI